MRADYWFKCFSCGRFFAHDLPGDYCQRCVEWRKKHPPTKEEMRLIRKALKSAVVRETK